MSGQINKIEVTIHGEKYVLKGCETPEYMEMLAFQLNKRLKHTQGINPRLSTIQAAILTALNILDDYTKIQQEYRSLVELLEEPDDKTKR